MATTTQLIDQAAAQYGVPVNLETALLRKESGLNPLATSYNRNSVGLITSTDQGIAQINSVAHPEVSRAQAYDPIFAIPWSARTLAGLKQQLGSWQAALEAYNGGVGGYQYAQANPGSPLAQKLGSYAGSILGASGVSDASGSAAPPTGGAATLLGVLPGTLDQGGLILAVGLLIVGLIWLLG